MRETGTHNIDPVAGQEYPDLAALVSGRYPRALFLRSMLLGLGGLGLSRLGFARVPVEALTRGRPPAVALKRYYGHDAVTDDYGVIAPWYKGLNGQCDYRIRIAAETMKRYPWSQTKDGKVSYPDYLFTSNWSIAPDGAITPRHHGDWSNGDLGQRAIAVLDGMTDYYRYSGDAAAIAHITYMGEYVLAYALTPEDHPWPRFPISVPMKGKAYDRASPEGMIQLDIAASMGEKLLRAYQVTGRAHWLEAVKHWGDLLAEHARLDQGQPTWPRYANPETVPWQDHPRMQLQTGSVVMILQFLDALLRIGYSGKNDRIASARDAGVRYLREQLLPEWWMDKTWGCYFWDWIHDMQEVSISAYVSNYMMQHREEFPGWEQDVRNILLLFIHRATADPKSGGDVYSGAWAFPESSMCCQRSLWYSPIVMAPTMLQYANLTGDEHMREMAYRMLVLQTYDIHETGVTEDLIDGGINVNSDWLNIAVPMPLQFIQHAMAQAPDLIGPSRENHVVDSSSVVQWIQYAPGRIRFRMFDAPAPCYTTLRLGFTPLRVVAGGKNLGRRSSLDANGYTIEALSNGDTILRIRHDGLKELLIGGKDPQRQIPATGFRLGQGWERSKGAGGIQIRSANKGSAFTVNFTGNQCRLIGSVGPWGGRATVFLDDEKQPPPIDCWNPEPREGQVLYSRNGLTQGPHTLRLVVDGSGNFHAKGAVIAVEGLQYSAAEGRGHFPSGGGSTRPQRMIFGYKKRSYRDSEGNLWLPGLEVTLPLFKRKDPVALCWMPEAREPIQGTPDPELYRYGIMAEDFWVNLTVAPGTYDLRLLFALTREEVDYMTGFDIRINEEVKVKSFNLPGTAGGFFRATDLVFRDIRPVNGVIQVRLTGTESYRNPAILQALELGQHLPATGVEPKVYK